MAKTSSLLQTARSLLAEEENLKVKLEKLGSQKEKIAEQLKHASSSKYLGKPSKISTVKLTPFNKDVQKMQIFHLRVSEDEFSSAK